MRFFKKKKKTNVRDAPSKFVLKVFGFPGKFVLKVFGCRGDDGDRTFDRMVIIVEPWRRDSQEQ